MRALIKIFGIIAALSAAISCSPSSKTAKAAADGSFRLLYWNIQNGMWSGQQDGHEKFVNWIKEQDPDVCVWCEGQANYVTNSTRNLPDDPDKYLYGFWKEMSGRYGHKFVAFSGRRDRFAQVVTSKYPIRTVAQLVGEEPDSVVTHGSGWFAVELGGRTINLVTLHTWPQPWAFRCEDREASAKVREGDDYRRMEIQYICEHTIGKVPDASSQYWMMMGDFNSRSRRDNYVYGYPDRDTRFLVQDYIYGHTPYIDVIGTLYPGEFMTTTGGQSRIDFIYCTKPLFDSIEEARVVSDSYTTPVRDPQNLSNFWHPSDHRPFIVDFNIR